MIGVFDSGSGGLTVLRALRQRLPSSDIVYFGDIGKAPYGSRSRDELAELTVQAISMLRQRGASSILSACNSVSASLAVSLYDAFDITPDRLIEMVGPTVAYFRGSQARLALCATLATIQSGVYQNAFRMIGMPIECVVIPDLAGAIEFGASREEMADIIRVAFAERSLEGFDALVLACTHYPLVADLFAQIVPIPLFDPAEAVAERVEREWWPRETGSGGLQFMISKESESFRALVARLFPNDEYLIEVVA